jgi:hypothetical protein
MPPPLVDMCAILAPPVAIRTTMTTSVATMETSLAPKSAAQVPKRAK